MVIRLQRVIVTALGTPVFAIGLAGIRDESQTGVRL
jgi:hypothetical protein